MKSCGGGVRKGRYDLAVAHRSWGAPSPRPAWAGVRAGVHRRPAGELRAGRVRPQTQPGRYVCAARQLVYPAQRTGRSVWLALMVVVASVVTFVGWRAQQSGASDSSSGVTYTSAAGHFSARFPAQPTDTVKSERHGPLRIVTHTTAVPGQAVVAEIEVVGRIPGDAQRFSRQMVASLTSFDGSELTSMKSLTLQGSPARQGNAFGPNTGQLLTVLVVARSTRRFYTVIAPTGADFDTLKASFRIRS